MDRCPSTVGPQSQTARATVCRFSGWVHLSSKKKPYVSAGTPDKPSCDPHEGARTLAERPCTAGRDITADMPQGSLLALRVREGTHGEGQQQPGGLESDAEGDALGARGQGSGVREAFPEDAAPERHGAWEGKRKEVPERLHRRPRDAAGPAVAVRTAGPGPSTCWRTGAGGPSPPREGRAAARSCVPCLRSGGTILPNALVARS